jgi:c-di-GMP-binding flagellar brake protein YcgR
MERGQWLLLKGAKPRDQHPPVGAVLTLSLLLGEQSYALRTTMKEITSSLGEAGPLIRVAWPTQILERHHREDLRVASPGMPALDAQVSIGGERFSAKLLNLSETGIGLGFAKSFPLVLRAHVDVQTLLPGDIPFQITGEVRHLEILDDETLPLRVGIVMGSMEGHSRERMRRFIQAKRTLLSEISRNSA